jgi:hypothetical protein
LVVAHVIFMIAIVRVVAVAIEVAGWSIVSRNRVGMTLISVDLRGLATASSIGADGGTIAGPSARMPWTRERNNKVTVFGLGLQGSARWMRRGRMGSECIHNKCIRYECITGRSR